MLISSNDAQYNYENQGLSYFPAAGARHNLAGAPLSGLRPGASGLPGPRVAQPLKTTKTKPIRDCKATRYVDADADDAFFRHLFQGADRAFSLAANFLGPEYSWRHWSEPCT
jgi:hypothetical protein